MDALLQRAPTGLQGTQTGLQGTQAGLQGTQAGLQGTQTGLQGTQAGARESAAGAAGDLLRRASGIVYGFGNQILFLITVWYLFWFLRDGTIRNASGSWVLRDCLLATVFAVAHSIMLYPATRKRLTRWIPQPFYDSTFCVVTCISLLVMFFGWRSSETVVWEATGSMAAVIHGCFYLSWAALFYSLALTGLGYQNGWTPFYHWLKREKAPRREFKPRGAYKLFRHPVYLSFLGLVWFIPKMTLDHAALTAIWTAYIFIGSAIKDRRLTHYIGDAYRQYSASVPGYPLFDVPRRVWAKLAR